MSETRICERPPEGWNCSRSPDHEGPCAARPAWIDELRPLTFDDLVKMGAAIHIPPRKAPDDPA